MGYNGSAILAMAGKDCVAIACDRRYGVQVCLQAPLIIICHSNLVMTQAQTMATDRNKVFKMHDKLYIGKPSACGHSDPIRNGLIYAFSSGLSGLATDQSTFHEKLKFRLAMYNLREVVRRFRN